MQQTVNPNDDIKLYALDSATLHARALLEFFISGKTVRNHLSMDLYGLEEIYIGPILRLLEGSDESLSHACKRTPWGHQLTSFDGDDTKHLKYMPVDFGREVVDLWGHFIQCLPGGRNSLATLAQTKLDEASTRAFKVVTNPINESYGVAPIAWVTDE